MRARHASISCIEAGPRPLAHARATAPPARGGHHQPLLVVTLSAILVAGVLWRQQVHSAASSKISVCSRKRSGWRVRGRLDAIDSALGGRHRTDGHFTLVDLGCADR